MNRSMTFFLTFVLFLMLTSISKAKELEKQNEEPTPDIGCTENRPALCSDGGCYENYSFCKHFRGCISVPETLMCPSGVCTSDFGLCSENSYECELDGYKRCSDGICRKKCHQIFTNGCPSTAPFYCPSSKCGKTMLECTGILIRLSMFSHKTLFMCQSRMRFIH